jgi:hypothetical protein
VYPQTSAVTSLSGEAVPETGTWRGAGATVTLKDGSFTATIGGNLTIRARYSPSGSDPEAGYFLSDVESEPAALIQSASFVVSDGKLTLSMYVDGVYREEVFSR